MIKIFLYTVIFFASSVFIILIPEILPNCPYCDFGKITTSKKTILFSKKTKHIAPAFDYNFNKVPRIYLYSLPKDFKKFTTPEKRKLLFIKIILPQILKINEKILSDRTKIKNLYDNINKSKKLNKKEKKWIKKISNFYNCLPCSEKKLLTHVDIIVPSIAIAQAGIESGWGISRFALHGNAIFGLRTFNLKKQGIYPLEATKKNFKVSTYETLLNSIWAYSITLNSHSSYKNFRKIRAEMRNNKTEYDLDKLVSTLEVYSEKGKEYTNLILSVIINNNMKYFDNLTLDETTRKE